MTPDIILILISPFVGSFLANLIVRLPLGEPLLWSRSRCRQCEKPLAPRDLVPLLSWLIRSGRCRHCGARISPLYPAVELAAIAIAVCSIAVLPDAVLAGLTCLLGWTLLVLALIDWRTMMLPDVLNLPLIPLGFLMIWWQDESRLAAHAIAAVAIVALLLLLGWFIGRLKGREALGLGDIKLSVAAAAWTGPAGIISTLAWASFTGLAYGVWLLRRRSDGKTQDSLVLPFGPFLALGFWLTWLFGPLSLG